MAADWSADRRLDILVLGPMGEDEVGPTSTIPIRDALERLLAEPALQALLAAANVQTSIVHVPEGQSQAEIVDNVLNLLDTADLVVFNLNPKGGNPDRANVFYELGLVHALGIPSMLVVLDGIDVPFYVQSMTQHRVADFATDTLADALRAPLRDFLDGDDETSFANDRVSQFYGMPVVDISAAVGLATGYYDNFLSRLITESSFLSAYPDAYREVVYVRPSTVTTTYQADQERLRAALGAEGLDLTETKLDEPPSDRRGSLWFYHVDGIVLDIPRAIYPLRRSPRLNAFMDRNRRIRGDEAKRTFSQRLAQLGETLLDHVQSAIEYHVIRDSTLVRADILHYTAIEEAPALVQRLRAG